MKSTAVCIHVLPYEIEMFERFMEQYKAATQYLDSRDKVTLVATLNLNPKLTDWENSDLIPDHFRIIFLNLLQGVDHLVDIADDTWLMGTTQCKRENIKLDFNQFIFVDADIVFPAQLLKYQIWASEHLEGKYIILPNLVKLWDRTWDPLVHDDFKFESYDYHLEHKPEITINQEIDEVELVPLSIIKFGCGMHTLYSKEFWDFISIPEEFGGYGPEDTFGMMASEIANRKGHKIKQYLLKGIYISEDYLNREPTFMNKIKIINHKQEFRQNAERQFNVLLQQFNSRI